MPVTSNDIINNAQAIADLINAGANKKLLPDLTAATSLGPADYLHVSQGGVDKKIPFGLTGLIAGLEPSGDGLGQQLPILSPDGTTHYIRINNDGEIKSA